MSNITLLILQRNNCFPIEVYGLLRGELVSWYRHLNPTKKKRSTKKETKRNKKKQKKN